MNNGDEKTGLLLVIAIVRRILISEKGKTQKIAIISSSLELFDIVSIFNVISPSATNQVAGAGDDGQRSYR